MPSLQFKGKNIIWNHHQSPLLPTHTLDLNKDLSYNAKNANGNLIVEGDNLLALKALLPEYQGKVDCIYIDPPYNTGNEGWVYNDKVNSPMINEWIGQTVGKEAEDFTRHDKWLCMMTPRLKLLHEMLSDKGVIFVSIDDNEVHHLRMLMNEIWGEENFVDEIIVQTNPRGSQSSTFLANTHEYILVYGKNMNELILNGLTKADGSELEYKYFDTIKNDKYRLLGLRQRGGAWKKEDRPKMYYPIYINPLDGSVSLEKSELFTIECLPKRPTGEEGRWTWSKEKLQLESNMIFGKKVKRDDDENYWDVFRKDYFSDEFGDIKETKAKTIWAEKEVNYQNGRTVLKELFNLDIFDYPKPVEMVKKCLILGSSKSSIILDSFAGSGTTAQAVLELNKDGGNRKFVLVQMPEEIKPETPAGKYCMDNNLPLKISSITRERVRLAIEKKINPVVVDKGELEGLEVKRQEIGFEYYNLGAPLDSWSIISSQSSAELPSFGKLASYIWKNLTGEKREFALSNIDGVNKFCLGEYKGEKVFLLYEQDLPKLNGRELCMSLPIAKELEELYPNTPKLIYSPTCYLDDWHREKYQIRYINYPFGV
jgi:adenine-specific DNA-methyltransferase